MSIPLIYNEKNGKEDIKRPVPIVCGGCGTILYTGLVHHIEKCVEDYLRGGVVNE